MIQLKRWTPSGSVYNYSTPLKINTNTWQKIEFRLYRDSSIGQYRVYVNESEIISLLNIDTSSSATIPANIWVGATASSLGISTWNIWIDDVTISTFRVTSLTGAWNCGSEQISLPYFYATGNNSDWTSNKYGLKARSAITNPFICGNTDSDASVGGAMINMQKINNGFIEVGWYKGIYSTYSLSALDVPHYFRGYNDIYGRHYVDLSTTTGTYPVISNPSTSRWANFTMYGSTNSSNNTWTMKIESTDHSTITSTQTLYGNKGTAPEVFLEFHNTKSAGTAHFKNIQNGVDGGGYISWQDWSSSYPIDGAPYRTRWISYKEYCMYTDPQATCP
jgi:hypothetical protein